MFLFNGDQVATQPWVTTQLGGYLPLTGGTVNGNLNVKGTIQAQDSNGNNKVSIYGTANASGSKLEQTTDLRSCVRNVSICWISG